MVKIWGSWMTRGQGTGTFKKSFLNIKRRNITKTTALKDSICCGQSFGTVGVEKYQISEF